MDALENNSSFEQQEQHCIHFMLTQVIQQRTATNHKLLQLCYVTMLYVYMHAMLFFRLSVMPKNANTQNKRYGKQQKF